MLGDYLWQVLDPVEYLAPCVGIDPRALRMVATLILSAIGAICYHWYFWDADYEIHSDQTRDRHLALFMIGFLLGFYNYGFSILRTFATVLVVYAILSKFKGSRTSVTLTFLISTGHLVYGYWCKFDSGEDMDMYIFDWTVPHCVLTLKLIAVAFDLLDGTVAKSAYSSKKKEDSKTKFNQDRIECVPSLLQLLSHSYFPGSFLVGPQFSIKHTIAFVEDDLEDEDDILMSVWVQGLRKIVLSFYYLAVVLLGSHFFPPEHLLSEDYQVLPFFWRLIYFTISVRLQFYRYFFFFLFSEGNCILYGVNFDGNKNAINYKLCSNVDPIAFDFTGISFLTSFNQGYNICTNRWIGKYVFHRLPYIKFSTTSKPIQASENLVNHRYTRFFISSMFVCLWHGFHPGYLFSFTHIAVNYTLEWDFLEYYWPIIQRTYGVQSFKDFKPITKILLYMLLKIYVVFSLSCAFVSMLFLRFERFISIFKSIFFLQHLLFLLYIVIRIIIRIIKK